MINFRFRILVSVLTLILVLTGGMTTANAQNKPPLLGAPSVSGYGQTPPPTTTGQVPPPPTNNMPQPPPTSPGMAPPHPPSGNVQPPPTSPGNISQPPPPSAGQNLPPTPTASLSEIQQNLPGNIVKAVATARKAKVYLKPGKVWVITGPRGEAEVKAAITYDGVAVAVIRFNPQNGDVLPLGVHPITFGVKPTLEIIKRTLPSIVGGLEVLNGAEYREPENVWVVPLAYKEMIVAHLKIFADGIHVVPDYPANQEMRVYGK